MFGSDWNGIGGLLALLGLGSKTKDSIQGMIYDESKKADALASGKKTYIDRRGVERNISTNNKTWNVVDNDGYDITIDSKTKEVLINGQRESFLQEKKEAKNRAIRGGYAVYSYPVKRKTSGRFPKTEYEFCRTSDDKPVDYKMGHYVLPIFGLVATDNKDYTIRNNREALYRYCRIWYVDNNMKGPHPKEIKNMATDYGVVIFDKDLEYCLDKINLAIKNGGSIELASSARGDAKYRNATWVDKKYWF